MKKSSKLPEKIGGLVVVASSAHFPGLYEEYIHLPEKNAGIIPLARDQYMLITTNGKHYFLGIDEKPFLSEVSANSINEFNLRGVAGFYESLKPWIVKEFSTPENQPIRQGDIWGLRIANFMGNIKVGVLKNHVLSINLLSTKKKWLFSTRHQLEGSAANAVLITSKKQIIRIKSGMKVKNIRTEHVIFGQGMVSAPDHQPLDISDGIYALSRTPGIKHRPYDDD